MEPISMAIAGSALLSSLFGARQSKKNTQQQIAFQKAEAEKERQHALHMWNLSNEYNAPAQQMARLQQAGLNPNLAYGSGNVAGLSSGQPEHYKRAGGVDFHKQESYLANAAGQVPEVLGMYQDYKLKQANITNQRIIADWQFVKQQEESMKRRTSADKMFVEAARIKHLTPYQTQAAEEQVRKIRESTRSLQFENEISEMLKPYGLTSRDDAMVRQLARIIQRDNPNISTIDAVLLIPTILQSLGKLK